MGRIRKNSVCFTNKWIIIGLFPNAILQAYFENKIASKPKRLKSPKCLGSAGRFYQIIQRKQKFTKKKVPTMCLYKEIDAQLCTHYLQKHFINVYSRILLCRVALCATRKRTRKKIVLGSSDPLKKNSSSA